jgi:hypothetical protein
MAIGQATMSSFSLQWRPVHGGPGSRWSTTHGLSPWICQFKNKSKNQLSQEFSKEAPGFLCHQATVPKISMKTPGFQNISKNTPNNFLEIPNCNSDFVDSCTKIFRITSSFSLCIHLTHVCCILLIDCVCFMFGNIVLEPFSKDFQDKAFKESQLFFVDLQGKLP